MTDVIKVVHDTLASRESELLEGWMEAVGAASGATRDTRAHGSIADECKQLLSAVRAAAAEESGGGRGGWSEAEREVDEIAGQRVKQGVEPAETSAFVNFLRRPLLLALPEQNDRTTRIEIELAAMSLLDRVQQRLVNAYIVARDGIIRRHQEDMLELSTPVVKLWDGVLALPLIGTLDSRRAQLVLQTLLERIAETSSRIAIIDITGVPMVDTLVAQNLIKAVTATRLMGAECILSGIRPQIAQTIVQLGVDLSEVVTKATLADGFVYALERFEISIQDGSRAS